MGNSYQIMSEGLPARYRPYGAPHPDVAICNDCSTRESVVQVYVSEIPEHEEEAHPTCIQEGEGCSGQVQYRMALSGTGKSFPRCDGHWSKRLDLEDRLRRDYPDTDTPPSWFDPTYAGEHWNDDY